MNYSEFCTDLSILPHLARHLNQYELMDIYFLLSVLIQYSVTYFLAQIVPVLAIGTSVLGILGIVSPVSL